MTINSEKKDRSAVRCGSPKAWILAARPKTLTGAAIPVILGSALAYSDGKFGWRPALTCLLFALLMQIAANFINDLFDFLKGSDRADRLGPQRACAQGWITPKAMKKGIAIIVITACLAGLTLILYGGWPLIFIGIGCVLFAFLYTAGPYPLSYHGWGDVLVLAFFGFVPVGGTYYVQALSYTPKVAAASLACGLVIDTLLVVNNFRDRFTDARDGKKTLIVRLGDRFGKFFYLGLGIAAIAVCLTFAVSGMRTAAALPLLYLIPHIATWKEMVRINEGKKLNFILGETSRNMFLFCLLFSLGLVLS
ncbi:MAG TPA: 1,4-dihydroxy-2-naphthoate polyprenyltransferase [Fibrobacteraceae bacterium]|nr:1,4-dihydroxy-2-naphthoate polyprenyltransferase [Fibrobacteraceae bacterium]